MAEKKICPNCLSDMVAESIGWKCENCLAFLDMQGVLHEHKEKPFMPPMTNADRIRAELENDEELAALYVRYNPDTHMYHTDAGAFTDFVAAMDAELEYLQQPSEGE